ncbi:hypothetical protein JRQ81_012132 [Phrynocephalus forsythii]|uniref:Uncharacterized protein n=1 Tax=Phrynocephalus forsythii TaxID=171643 RepID=A0A9Q0X5C0_9SAUR|nr:hypothetical protein JRQ81_012132 [Phrynocephalus forsythii]
MLGGQVNLCLPSSSAPAQNDNQTPPRTDTHHPHSALVALTTLVPDSQTNVDPVLPPSTDARSTLTGRGTSPTPGPSIATPHALAHQFSLQQILAHARKPSTTALYSYKWREFVAFTTSHHERRKVIPQDSPTKALCLRNNLLKGWHLHLMRRSTLKSPTKNNAQS